MNGACDNTGTLMAADIVSPARVGRGTSPATFGRFRARVCPATSRLRRSDLAVTPDSSAPNERYELKDEIALRNSTRSVGCTGPGAPAQLVFTTQPSGAVPNAAFSTSPVVTAEDGAGNVITNYSGTVALSIKSGTGTSGAALTGCSAVNLNGATTFTGCKIDKPGSGYVLVAADGAFMVESNPFNVVSGQAATLAVTGYPSPTTSGASHRFTVTAKDSAGNTATGYTGTVHFTSSDAAAVLPANYTFTAGDNGTHTFNATLKTLGNAVDHRDRHRNQHDHRQPDRHHRHRRPGRDAHRRRLPESNGLRRQPHLHRSPRRTRTATSRPATPAPSTSPAATPRRACRRTTPSSPATTARTPSTRR